MLQLVGLLGALPWVRGRMPRQAKSTKVKLNAKAMQFIKDHENDPKSGKELIHCARNMRTVKEAVWKDKARVVHRKKAGFVQLRKLVEEHTGEMAVNPK